jgi:hypothetical protein
MKLYTFYTDSHSILYDSFFKKSLSIVDNIDLVYKKESQKCTTASYMDSGWLETMKFKVQLHIEASKQFDDQYFIYSDCDIIFLDSNLVQILLEELDDNDIAFQNDVELYGNRPTCCAGFFISKTNKSTLSIWENVLYMLHKLPQYTNQNDQTLLNLVLDHMGSNIKYKLLSNRFFTLAQYRKELWDKKTNFFDFEIPTNIITYHANWTHGVSNKINLLNMVKSKKQI